MSSCGMCKYHVQYDEVECDCEKLGCTEHEKFCYLQGGKEECPYFELDGMFKD